MQSDFEEQSLVCLSAEISQFPSHIKLIFTDYMKATKPYLVLAFRCLRDELLSHDHIVIPGIYAATLTISTVG